MPKYAKTKDSSGPASSKRVRYVPFARGFKFRDENSRLRALGFSKSANVPKEFSCGPDEPLVKKTTPSGSSASSSSTSASTSSSLSSPSSFSSSEQFFQPVPQPTSQDDWLAQYDEDGQTFPQFLQENPWMSARKVKYIKQSFCSQGSTLREKYPNGKVCLLQLGKFDHQHLEFSDLVDYTARFLCLPVDELPPLELDTSREGRVVVVDDPVRRYSGGRSTRIKHTELHCRHNAKTGRLQVRVDSVLSKLRTLIPPQALCLIALTTLDLYGDNSDLFVAGMAAGLQRVAVFSVCRYHPCVTFSPEHWYDVKTVPRPVAECHVRRLMIQRSCKLVVHEILHLLGVDHCVFYDCCMNGSGHLAEDFRQPMHLCPVDLRKLHTLVGFDVCERYRSLLQFYARHGLVEEARWVDRRLKYLDTSA